MQRGTDAIRGGAALLLAPLLFLGGCGGGATAVRDPLPDAILLMQRGQEDKARQLLKTATRPGTAPVGDETLFRLALLHLRGDLEEGEGEAILILERLRREHPKSDWTLQSAPLLDFLQKNRAQRKTMRDQQGVVTKENRELRKTIERVKALELQLEQRRK